MKNGIMPAFSPAKPGTRHPRRRLAQSTPLLSEGCLALFWRVNGVPFWKSATLDHLRDCRLHPTICRAFHSRPMDRIQQGKASDRHRKTDFATGIIQGFREKLDSGPVLRNPDTRALVKLKILLEELLAYRYPRTVRVRRNISYQDERVLRDRESKIGRNLIGLPGYHPGNGPAGVLLDH